MLHPIGVLFVCLGNICRSPMAEALFRHEVEKAGLADRIRIDSCGTGDWHIGSMPHVGTRRILDKHGINHEGQRARQFSKDDIANNDYIIAMDRSNVQDLLELGVPEDKLTLLLDYVDSETDLEIPDPYYTGDFDQTYDLVQKGVKELLGSILEEHSLSKRQED